MTAPAELRAGEARRLALAAQGLLGAPPRTGPPVARVDAMLRRLGAVQLDTISVLARSHELVAHARLGAVPRAAIEAAYWGRPPRAIEFWAHAACLLPIEHWPWTAARRRRGRRRYLAGDRPGADARTEVLARLRGSGPLTTEGLGGARDGGPWWSWSPLKVAAEELLAAGEVVCVERRGWRRVYDLPERVLPADVLGVDPDDAGCHARLVALAAARLGVATVADLADYFRLSLVEARAALADNDLVPVRVEGWAAPAWADPGWLEALAAGRLTGRPRTVLLSPFDSLIWDRRRTQRLFAFVHRLEAYVPAALRTHGYFSMPLLTGGRLRGRVDPKREGTTLVARQVSMDSASAVSAMATALLDAAAWAGCSAVVVGGVAPAELADPLRVAIARLGG